MRTIEVTEVSSAAPELVWALLADPTRWTEFTPLRAAVVERPGDADRLGAGMIRRLSAGPVHIREQITAADAPRRSAYTLLSGIPLVSDYSGEVRLTPEGGGTRVDWTVRVDSRVPGYAGVAAAQTRLVIRRMARGLARAAER